MRCGCCWANKRLMEVSRAHDEWEKPLIAQSPSTYILFLSSLLFSKPKSIFRFQFFFFFAFVGAFCRFCCIRWIYTLNLPIAFPMNRRGKIGRAGVGMVFAKTLLRLVRRYMYIFHQPPYNIIDFLFVKFNRKPFMAPYVQIAGNFIASRRWWEREREIERCVYVLFVHIRT